MNAWRAAWNAGLSSWHGLLPVAALVALRIGLKRFPRAPRPPILLFVLHALIRPLANLLSASGWDLLAGKWTGIAASLLLTWAVIRLAVYMTVEWPAVLRKREPPAKVGRDLILAVAYGVTGFILLRTSGQVNLAGLLTTSAVITAVIGFASQTVLSSFFSGIALQIEHPFGVGDWIEIDGHIGQVVGITWRSTRLLDRKRRLVYLPNALVAASLFRVFTRPDPVYTAMFTIGLEYDAPPNRVRAVILEVVRRHPRVRATPAPEVRLVRFGDSSIEYEVRFSTADCANESRTLADLRNDLWYALRRAGLRIPFPIRDVRHAHVERRTAERAAQAKRERLRAVLSEAPVLSPLSEDERDLLVVGGVERTFGEGEALLQRGAQGKAMFILLTGTCSVHASDDPAAAPVAVLRAGDCCGEMSLLTGSPCAATVRADTDVTAFRIDPPLFRKILLARPEVAERLAELLAGRRRELDAFNRHAHEGATTTGSLLTRIRAFFHL